MEQNTRLPTFHQNPQFQLAVREYQRQARDAVSQAALVSSARHEVTLILEVRQATCHNQPTMQHRERDILLRLGEEAQDALWQQRAYMVHEQHHFVEEGEAAIHVIRYQMESEQRASLRILESVSQDRDFVRQKAQHLRDKRRDGKETMDSQCLFHIILMGKILVGQSISQ